jgi:hypothetical protein
MRFNAKTALAAALATLLSTAALAQQAPINPANLPSPLPTKGITDTLGITTGAGIVAGTPTGGMLGTGKVNISGAYNINGSEVINLYANATAPIIPNSAQNTVVQTASYFNRPQVIGYSNTIDSTTQNTYAGSLTDLLTINGTMTNHWGELYNAVNIQAGSGTITGEFNIQNNSLQIGTGNTVRGGEIYEGQVGNSGIINNIFSAYMSNLVNSASGTVVSPGILMGYNDIWTNNNTTAGSLWQHVTYHCSPMTGAGSAPTFDYCLKNDDPNGLISTPGTVSIGTNLAPGAGVQLKILAPSAAAGVYPLQISATGGIQNILLVNATGEIDMRAGPLLLGNSGSVSGLEQVFSSTAGNAAQIQGGDVNGSYFQIIGTLKTGTPTSSACWGASGVLISNAGCGAVPSTQLNGALTVSTLPTCNTAARGTTQMVSDANAPAYNTTLAGSGSAYVKAFCNGVNWVGG